MSIFSHLECLDLYFDNLYCYFEPGSVIETKLTNHYPTDSEISDMPPNSAGEGWIFLASTGVDCGAVVFL